MNILNKCLEHDGLLYCLSELKTKGEKIYYAVPDYKEWPRKHSVLDFKVNYLS